MNSKLDILKGIHPGVFVKRELKRRKLKSGEFAKSISEHPQTLSAIIHGRRAMNTSLSLRIENLLDLEEGLLMTMQVYYDIEIEKRRQNSGKHPDFSKLESSLFWDTTLDNIDFINHRRYVIQRVFERGTEEAIKEIIRFYGKDIILQTIKIIGKTPFTEKVNKNIDLYLNYEKR